MSDLLAALPPAAPHRPGPGPMPAGLLGRLELGLGRRLGGLAVGESPSGTVGPGAELARVRGYVPGDDVRRLHPAATARTGRTHVRVDVAERAITTWLVLDRTASMRFGTAERRKADVGMGVGLALGLAATKRGNRLGTVAFGDGHTLTLPPRGSRHGVLGAVRALQEEDGDPAPGEDLAGALRHAERVARQRSMVVVVSDLRGPRDFLAPLARLAARHEVLAVEIRDPREAALPDVGEVTLVDPETGRRLRVDTGRRRLRERFAEAAVAERAHLAGELRGLGVDHVVLGTDGPWLAPLAAHLARPARRR